jgi:hypothetical protein
LGRYKRSSKAVKVFFLLEQVVFLVDSRADSVRRQRDNETERDRDRRRDRKTGRRGKRERKRQTERQRD